MKTYKFRIYPNKEQEQTLFKHFDCCRFVYNQLLEELSRNKNKNYISHFILSLKEKYPILKDIYSKTLQCESDKLFHNIKSLSESKKNGNKIGRLRFKGRDWFKTIVYNQSGYKIINTKKRFNILNLSKIGDIKILQHRKIEGNIKGIIIKKKVDSWEAHIITDAEYKLNRGDGIIGIDLGIINFIVDNNNNKIDNPLYLKQSLLKLKHKQQLLSKKKRGSIKRLKAKKIVARLYEHIVEQRNDFLHKITTKLINNNKFIGVEDLNIQSMEKSSYNARNIVDSSWGKFLAMLCFKAESADCKVIKVAPNNTTKMCSNCKKLQDIELGQRVYTCKYCGLVIGRDHNAAINILKKALEQGSAEVINTIIEAGSHVLNHEAVRA